MDALILAKSAEFTVVGNDIITKSDLSLEALGLLLYLKSRGSGGEIKLSALAKRFKIHIDELTEIVNELIAAHEKGVVDLDVRFDDVPPPAPKVTIDKAPKWLWDTIEYKQAHALYMLIRVNGKMDQHCIDNPEDTKQVWADVFDKLKRIDGWTDAVIWGVIRFLQADKFWIPQGAIRSATKLRERQPVKPAERKAGIKGDHYFRRFANDANLIGKPDVRHTIFTSGLD